MAVTLYGLSGDRCKYCKQAAAKLDSRNVKFTFVDIESNPDLFKFFKSIHKTVPQIYEDEVYLGDSSAASFAGRSEEVDSNEEFTL